MFSRYIILQEDDEIIEMINMLKLIDFSNKLNSANYLLHVEKSNNSKFALKLDSSTKVRRMPSY